MIDKRQKIIEALSNDIDLYDEIKIVSEEETLTDKVTRLNNTGKREIHNKEINIGTPKIGIFRVIRVYDEDVYLYKIPEDEEKEELEEVGRVEKIDIL